ncbi:MAG TPA: Hpt domain-containing protein, partial [Steroidobacter sp.]|nr:Hpt domain-containing protein [Steroidobacter sp.]
PREAQAVDQIPQLVRGITAGLLMLGKTRAVEIMEGVDRELSRFLRSDGLTLPQEAVDRLADAIVAVEYYMETLQAGRTDPWYMLDNAEACLKFLGQARAVPRAELADSEHTRTLVIEPMSTTVAAPTEHERTAVLYRTVEPASAKAPAAAPRTPPAKTPDRDIDPEFLELFIEEAKDEIARLKSLFPRWDENPQDQEALVNVRRSFHTLKGSGRMVGAQLIGEFAWSIENLLNRVINKTLERTPDMMALLREAIAAAPELVEQLESGRAPGVDVERIIALANDISGLRSAAPSVAAPAAGAAPAPAAASAPVGAAQEKKTESRATAQPEIDPALHEIYAKETAGHLAVIREFMAACEQASPPYPVTEQLHRSCHTLIGAARTAGARQGVKVAEPLNRYIRKLYDNSIGLSVAGLQALKDASEAITRVVEHIHEDTGFFVDHPKLIARLNELEHSLDVEISRLAEALDATMERPALESHEAGRRANLEPFGANTGDVADTGDVIEIEPTDASMLAVMNWSFEHLPPPSRSANGAHQSDSAQSAPPQQVAPQAPEFLASKDSTLAAPELDAQQKESLAVEVSAAGDFALEDADVQVADAEPAESRDSKLDLLQAEPSAAQHPDRPRQEDALDGVLVEESAAQRTPAGADDAEIGSDIVVETAAWAADFKAPVLQAEPSESSSDAALTQPSGEDCTLETATIVADPDSVGAPAPLETPRAPTAAAAAALEAPGQDSEDDASDADFDPEVAAIFAEEAAELLEAADQSLSSWRSDRANNALVFELKRVVHTLKGGARMAGVRAMGDLSHELETFMQLVESGQVPAEESVFDALQASLDELHRMRDLVNQGERCAPARQLMARIRALAAEPESASEPAPASPSPQPAAAVESSRADHAEPPVLDEYVEVLAPQASSATDIVPTLTEAFIGPDVEPQPTASAAPASGLADSAAAERGGEAAQTAPDAFPEGVTGDVDAQPVGSGAELRASPADDLEVIGGAVDDAADAAVAGGAHAAAAFATDGAVVEGADTGVDEDGANAVSADADSELQAEFGADELGAAAPRKSVRVSETPPASAAVEQAALDVASLAPELPPDAAEAPPERAPALPGRERQAVERQEFARVDAELLDTLLNNAGEVSIFRSRLEQQVSSIEFNLAELGRTVTRLKEQLRKLELETEAQILHRHEDERPGRADFDPLELDRYSTIQQLSRAFAESVSDVASIEGLLENLTREAQNLLLQQSRVVTELQNGLMRTRMVPFQRHVQRLSRLVRQVAADTQKRAELVVVGASGELDRQVLERMLPPFEHMLRNSVVHGMETPQERIAAGKPETGVIRVGLHREGSEMVIVLEDDGRGIDVDAVRERARARGLLKPGRELS